VARYISLSPEASCSQFYLYEDYYYETACVEDISPDVTSEPIAEHNKTEDYSSPFKASISILNVPKEMLANQTYIASILVKNLSNHVLSPSNNLIHLSNTFLAYHWFRQIDTLEEYVWEGLRFPLPSRIEPGEQVKSFLPVKAPSEKGIYFLQSDIVEEGIAWFSKNSSPELYEMQEIKILEAEDDSSQLGHSVLTLLAEAKIADDPSNTHPNELYDDSVYQEWIDMYANCASLIVTSLQLAFPIKTVVDEGSGLCIFANEFAKQGFKVVATDGSKDAEKYASKDIHYLQLDFRVNGFEKQLKLFHPVYDIAVCMEVAEHLPPESASSLIESLTNLSSIIVFTSAQPGQGGLGHFNEQPHAYWQSLFEQFGYGLDENLTKNLRIIWKSGNVAWWLSENLLIFRRQPSINMFRCIQKRFKKFLQRFSVE